MYTPYTPYTPTPLVILLYTLLLLTLRNPFSPKTLLEFPWLCNVLLLSSPLTHYSLYPPVLLQATLISVSIDHILWYVDISAYAVSGSFPVGVAKYLTWKTTSYGRVLTSTHHLWSMPLVLSQLRGYGATAGRCPVTGEGLAWSYAVTLCNVTLSRALLPMKAREGGEDVYLNVNLSREVWKDVAKFRFLRVPADSDDDPVGYVLGLGWRWCAFNTAVFGAMRAAYAAFG